MSERLLHLLTYHSDEPMIFSSGLFLMVFLCFTFIYMLLQRTLTLRLHAERLYHSTRPVCSSV